MCLYVSNATASRFTHLVLFTCLVHFFYQLCYFSWNTCSVHKGLGCSSIECIVHKKNISSDQELRVPGVNSAFSAE